MGNVYKEVPVSVLQQMAQDLREIQSPQVTFTNDFGSMQLEADNFRCIKISDMLASLNKILGPDAGKPEGPKGREA